MSLQDIMIKVALFFFIFYGAIILSSLIAKKFRKEAEAKAKKESKKNKERKKVLVLCTGNSCRSIIAEALINSQLKDVEAHSSGVAPSGKVNPNAKKVLESHNEWDEQYHSKALNTLKHINFDLVVTVCDHAHETCPIFEKPIPTIHISFEDPNGQAYEAFEKTYSKIKEQLLPKIDKTLTAT